MIIKNIIKQPRKLQLIGRSNELNSVRQITFFRRRKEKKEAALKEEQQQQQEQVITGEIVEKQSILDTLTDEQINLIRNKSNLTDEMRDLLHGHLSEQRKFTSLYQYDEKLVRQYYARFGKQSNLKPGIAWPSKEKLEFQKKFEETFYPSLEKLLSDLSEEKKKAADEILAREKDVEEKLKKLPKMKEEFYKKIHDREQQLQVEKAKKEKLIQEVREYLGYSVDPQDQRFQEALIKKEEEEKVRLKAAKKQEKQARLLASLAALTEETPPASKPADDKAAGKPADVKKPAQQKEMKTEAKAPETAADVKTEKSQKPVIENEKKKSE